MKRVFNHTHPFILESGVTLPGFHLAYTTQGKLNAEKSNIVWVFHALTANNDAAEWWPGLVGTGKIFDPSNYFIVCVNMPGSCYGSISPLDNEHYHNLPMFTIKDMVAAYQKLKIFLGIDKIHIK